MLLLADMGAAGDLIAQSSWHFPVGDFFSRARLFRTGEAPLELFPETENFFVANSQIIFHGRSIALWHAATYRPEDRPQQDSQIKLYSAQVVNSGTLQLPSRKSIASQKGGLIRMIEQVSPITSKHQWMQSRVGQDLILDSN